MVSLRTQLEFYCVWPHLTLARKIGFSPWYHIVVLMALIIPGFVLGMRGFAPIRLEQAICYLWLGYFVISRYVYLGFLERLRILHQHLSGG